MSVIGFPRAAGPVQTASERLVARTERPAPRQPAVLPGAARNLLTGLYEIGGVSLSRLAELQAGALQELAEANRVRVASVRAQRDLPALFAAERRFYSAVVTQLRHGLLARRDLLRDAGRSSAALLRTVADPDGDDVRAGRAPARD